MSASAVNPNSSRGGGSRDKRGGYSSLNLNYKQGRGDSKSYGKSGGHGMQSLGRVPTTRRVPNPASLPSLRSENSGNDPSVTLVPAGGSGWKSSGENKEKEDISSSGNTPVVEPPVEVVPVVQQQPPKPVVKGPPKSPGRMFKSEFPSLGEQGGLSKREVEERQRSRKEKGTTGDRGRSETHGAEGWQQGPGEKLWHDHGPPVPPGPHGHPMGPPPPPGGGHFGQYPPQGPYPYMMPPPPPHGQGPPYPNMPPPSLRGSGRGRGSRYPPPPMHYRPHYPPHYQQNPYEMPADKYRGHHGEDDVSRPPTIKADVLQQLDVGEDDVGGWAGHHEEVDYTKEVVFSDSSDEEAEGRDTAQHQNKAQSKEQTNSPAKKQSKDQMESFPRTTNNKPPAEPASSREQSRTQRSHERPSREEEPHDVEQPPPRHNMPPPFLPYPQPYHQYYPGYPPPHPPPHPQAQMYGHGPPFQMPPPAPPAPPTAPPAQHGQSHAQRYPRTRGNSDDLDWRHEDEERSKQQQQQRNDKNLAEERPRILTKPRSSADQEVESVLKNSEDRSLLPVQRTVSSSSDTPKHVTFEETQSLTTEENDTQAPPTRRAPQKRVMLRKFSDPETESLSETKGGGRRGHSKDGGNVRSDSTGEDGEPLTPDGETKSKPTAWTTDRGGNGKLYEPEGKKSAAKFMKYQAQSRGRKDSRGSQGSTTPTAEIEGRAITPEQKSNKTEKQFERNRTQSRSPAELHDHQNKRELDKPNKTQQDGGRRSYKDDKHEQRRGDKGQRDTKRTSDTQNDHQKGKEVSRTDSGGFEKRRDNRRNEAPSPRTDDRPPPNRRNEGPSPRTDDRPPPNRRNEAPSPRTDDRPPPNRRNEAFPPRIDDRPPPNRRNETLPPRIDDRPPPRDKPRRDRGARNNTPERKTDNIEHSHQRTESETKPNAVESLSQPRSKMPATTKSTVESTRPTDRGHRTGRGERSTKGHTTREREGTGRGQHSRPVEEGKSQSHDGRRGPLKQQPPRERDNRAPPPQRRKQAEDKPIVVTHKETTEKGYPAHGYSEVYDIESDLEIDEPTPVKQPDPNLTIAQRAREGQPLLPTPPIEKKGLDPTRNAHYPRERERETQKKHSKNREGELEDRRKEMPYTDLREKIRGNAEARHRVQHDEQRDRKNGPENTKSSSRKQPQSGEFSKNRNAATDADKVSSKASFHMSKTSFHSSNDKLDSIPSSSDVSLQVQSANNFNKYDLNSSGIVIIDELNPSLLEGRFSPSTQGEFTEVTSKKAQKEKNRKEKEEQRKLLEEKQREEVKRKRKQSNKSSADHRAPPLSDNKPHNAWSNPSWKDSSLPKSNSAPGSQLAKTFSSTASVGVIGQTLPPKEAVPHTAELKTTDVQPYTLFGDSSVLPPFPTSYPATASGGLLISAIDSTVTNTAPISQVPTATVTDKASKKSAAPSEKTTQSELQSKYGSGPVKTDTTSRPSKNLPPRLKSQQQGTGSGRGRSRREGRERRPGRQGTEEQGQSRNKSQPSGSSGRSTTATQHSTSQTATTDDDAAQTDADRFYVHPQRRGNTPDDAASKPHPPSKVGPVEDNAPRAPPLVSVATGQQSLRVGSSSSSVKSDGVSVKSESDTRPMSSSSSMSTTSSAKVDSNKSNKGVLNRPISAAQQAKNVSKTFSYAQALKSAGQPSSTASSSHISSRSVTPPISPFPNQRWTDDKSVPSSPSTYLPSDARGSGKTTTDSKDEPISLSVSEIDSVNEEVVSIECVDTDVALVEECAVGAGIGEPRVVAMEVVSDKVVTESVVSDNVVGMTMNNITTVARVDPVIESKEAKVKQVIITQLPSATVSVAVPSNLSTISKKDEMSSDVMMCGGSLVTIATSCVEPVVLTGNVPLTGPVPIRAHPSHLPTAHVLPMPHSTTNTAAAMLHPQPPYTVLPSHPHTSHYMLHSQPPPPHPLTTVPPPSLHMPHHSRVPPHTLHTSQFPQFSLQPHPGEVQKHPLMSTPTYMPEPAFPGNPALFGGPPGIRMPPPGRPMPPPAPPIMSTKSHEQLEAIAKVREYMAVTNAIDAQRKGKSAGKTDVPCNTGTIQRQYLPTPSGNIGLVEPPPIVRPPDLNPPQYPSVSIPNQGLYQKPLLSQPPPTRTQGLLPRGTGEFPPRLTQMPITPQQLAAFKHAQALHILLQQQQARKIAASNAYALSQSGPDMPFGPHSGYSMSHGNPPLQGNLPVKSAFTPYHHRNTVKPVRTIIQATSQPQAELVKTPPAEKVPQEMDEIDDKETTMSETDDDDDDQGADSVKSGLSATATPFVPSSNNSKRQQIVTTKTAEPITAPPPERPLLPSPGTLYQPSLLMRPPLATPSFSTLPQSVGAAGAFIQRPQLPMPLPQQIVSPGMAAHQQRKMPLGPPGQVIRGVSDAQLLALQHQQLMARSMYLAKQPEVGALQSTQLPMEMLQHIGQKKGYFSSKNIEQTQQQHRMPAHKMRSKLEAPQLSTLVPMPVTSRRTALLPTPTSATLLVANAPRLTQSAQPWSHPQVLSLSQNHAAAAALLTPEQLQRVSSMYNAGLNARPPGHRY